MGWRGQRRQTTDFSFLAGCEALAPPQLWIICVHGQGRFRTCASAICQNVLHECAENINCCLVDSHPPGPFLWYTSYLLHTCSLREGLWMCCHCTL